MPIPVERQLAQLQSPVDRLWWFAQLERGIEVADIDREPRYGSERVLSRLAEVYEPPADPRVEQWHSITVTIK